MRSLKIAALGLLAAAATVGSAASAASYDAVADFGNPVFTYGGGSTGAGFTALTNIDAVNCVGTPGISCYNTPGTDYTFPLIAKNISTSNPLTFYTNVLPKDELFMQSNPGSEAIIRFTAPTAGRYTFSGQFERIDSSNGYGDGSTVGISGAGWDASAVLANSRAGDVASYTYSFANTLVLGAGQSIDFFQSANSNVYWDGTGFKLSVSSHPDHSITVGGVPEPASWAMMVGGFGMVGGALRSRRSKAAVRFG